VEVLAGGGLHHQHKAVPAAPFRDTCSPLTETLLGIPSMSKCALHCVAKIYKLFFGRKNMHFIFCGNHRAF